MVACALAAAATLFAGTRPWGGPDSGAAVPLAAGHPATGSTLAPWLPALALVALAGAGALVAVRSTIRILLGWLLAAGGLGIVVTGGLTITGGARPLWPVATCGFGLAIAWAGWRATRRAAIWPAMSGRFERTNERTSERTDERTDGQIAKQTNEKEIWDALDRGEDPTR